MRLIELLKEDKGSGARPPFLVSKLPFAEDAVEAFANAETMRLHRIVHHQSYADGLNEALRRFPVLRAKTPTQMLDMYRRGELIGEAKQAVANFAGGFVNHELFWEMISPVPTTPSKGLAMAIDENFGSMEEMKVAFESAAAGVFGSGWAWLVHDPETNVLNVMSTSNQANPLMSRSPASVLLGLDMWEHAFYLTHKTDKQGYIKAFWKVANWNHASTIYEGNIP